MTYICVSKLTIIDSDNGLSPGRRQAIIWTNAGILLIRTVGTNFEILSEIRAFSFKKIHLKMSSEKWRPFCLGLNVLSHQKDCECHSVESPSMVDPQWNIWYWGSKWNLHTVCWSAVGCEWGTASVYFGITYVCFIPSKLPVFAVEPQYLLQHFLFLSKVSFELHIQNLQKISCWFKIWMGFVGPILIKFWTSSIWGFL